MMSDNPVSVDIDSEGRVFSHLNGRMRYLLHSLSTVIGNFKSKVVFFIDVNQKFFFSFLLSMNIHFILFLNTITFYYLIFFPNISYHLLLLNFLSTHLTRLPSYDTLSLISNTTIILLIDMTYFFD